MEYNKLVSITGIGGLYELLSSKSDGGVVRSLEDKSSKFVSTRLHSFSHIESVEVYTSKENVNLVEVFTAMKDSKENMPDANAQSQGTDAPDVPVQPTFVCPHCGAAMRIIDTFARGQKVFVNAHTMHMSGAPSEMGMWLLRRPQWDSATIAAMRIPQPPRSDSSAVTNMLDRNRTSVHLTRAPSSRAILHDTTGIYENARRAHPDSRGFLSLTLPGYSSDGRIAFVYANFSCGGGCGTSDGYWLQQRPDGSWRIVAKRNYAVV